MLEGLAFRFISLDDWAVNATLAGLGLAGFLTAFLLFRRAEGRLARVPYLLVNAALLLVAAALSLSWLYGLEVMRAGLLWLMVAATLVTTLAGGLLYGRAALARARDATDGAGYAFLALLPLANAILLVWPSRAEEERPRPKLPALTQGVTGFAAACLLLLSAAGLQLFIEWEDQRLKAERSPAESLSVLVRSQGLEPALALVAERSQTPRRVDELTTLTSVEADRNLLRRTFVVDRAGGSMNPGFRRALEAAVCRHPPFLVLLQEGALIEEVYLARDGERIGRHVVSSDLC